MPNSSRAQRPGSRAANIATLALVLQLLAPTVKNVATGFITPAARCALAPRSRMLHTSQSSTLDKSRRHDATMLRSNSKRVIVVSTLSFCSLAMDHSSLWLQERSVEILSPSYLS
jgi:hypothetical protein